MKRFLFSAFLTFACLLLLLGLIDSVALSAINANEMTALFQTHARLPESAGVTDYASLAQQLVKYLKTGDDRLLPQKAGASLFSEKENAHLKDCSELIRGLMAFRTGFLCLLGLMTAGAAAARFRGAARETLSAVFLAAFSRASAVLVLFSAVLLVWGFADFNSLFLSFHHVFFSNQLWLLDPGRDLLIQLMPESFFRAYAGRIAVRLAPVLLMMAALPFLQRAAAKEKRIGAQ